MFGEDLLSNLFARVSLVWSLIYSKEYLTEQDLINDHSKSKEVCFEGMVHPADDFGCHVAWSSTGFFRVAVLVKTGHPEVSDTQVSIVLEDEVLGLQIAVDDVS